MNAVQILPMTLNDHGSAMDLWQNTPGIGLSQADQPDAIGLYLQRNPGLSQCAWIDVQLVGTILAGHDGRRGYLHHLCVHTDHRRQGIGQQLVGAALQALAQAGLDKAHAFLFTENQLGRKFWDSIGWTWREDIGVVSRQTGGPA